MTLESKHDGRVGLLRETSTDDRLVELVGRLERILPMLETLAEQGQVQAWYSTADVARILSRNPYTVREWAREGRIHAEKRASGRGISEEWMISHDELMRVKSEGLLPINRHANGRRS